MTAIAQVPRKSLFIFWCFQSFTQYHARSICPVSMHSMMGSEGAKQLPSVRGSVSTFIKSIHQCQAVHSYLG